MSNVRDICVELLTNVEKNQATRLLRFKMCYKSTNWMQETEVC